MNFIHAVDGTEARGTPETLRRTATHYINLPGAKYSTRTAEKRPEIHRFTEPIGSEEPVASACQGLTLEIRRLPKKGVSHRLAPKMVQTWVDLFNNSIQIFSFCSSIEPSRFFKLFQLHPRTPSLGCASEGVGYRFPVLVQGHRAHAAPIANAKAAAGAVHGCGTPRAPETRRLHRWRG